MEPDDSTPTGAGWAFPVKTDHKGDISLSSEGQNVKDAIRIILGTAKGERVMQPEFGCKIHDQMFDTIDGEMLAAVERNVRDALTEWEPRIDVDDVNADRDPESPNKILVNIAYTVRKTNSRANMVYPFYVNE